jgi:excisionase family DNA binding protein
MKDKKRMARATLDSSTRMLTIVQACHRLAVSDATVRKLIANGKLRAAKIEGQWRIRPEALDAYVQLQEDAAHGPTVDAAVEKAFDADDHLPPSEYSFR